MTRAGSLLDRLEAELAGAGRPLKLEALAPALLSAAPGPLASKVLEGLIRSDGRFEVDHGAVRLLPRQDPFLDVALQDLTFAVIDFETNGLSPFDRAIEVGVARFRGGVEIGHYHTLLNPGTPISPFVVGLTGIRPEDLADRPSFAQVMDRVEEALAGAVMVAHNLPFDRRILRRELHLAGGGAQASRAALCTLALSRRLLPREDPKSLDALAERFSLRVAGRHRALGDARATGELLYKLVDLASERVDMTSWRHLKGFACPPPAVRGRGGTRARTSGP